MIIATDERWCRLLVFAEDETKISSQDFFTVLKNLALNPVARPYVWTWVRVKWPHLVERYSLISLYYLPGCFFTDIWTTNDFLC